VSGPGRPEVRRRVRVFFYDTDAGGVVHNIAYLRFVEQARSELAEHMGWPLEEMLRGPAGCPVVVRTEIDYLRPARLGDELEISSRLGEVGRTSFGIDTDVVLAAGGEVCARAHQVLVTVDLATGKPRRLRADWRERWG
jgi:acyl-CoA thioester hydrolase